MMQDPMGDGADLSMDEDMSMDEMNMMDEDMGMSADEADMMEEDVSLDGEAVYEDEGVYDADPAEVIDGADDES